MNQLRRYTRHAELYGPEGVLATARADGMGAADLGRLVMAVRRIDRERYERELAARPRGYIEPPWQLTYQERQRLGADLLEAGASDRFMRNVLNVGQATVRAMKSAE